MNFFYTEGYDEYAKFPMNYLRVTQSYDEGNHLAHWKNADYIDYPIDLGGIDSGRDFLFAPVNMRIVKIMGIGSSNVSNIIFLESVDLVYTPKHGKKKIFMTAGHFEDSDIEKFNLYEGKLIKAGEAICSEGKETATANHLHITCGLGSASKIIQNNQGKWVMVGDCKRPEEIFYVDDNFTIVKNTRGISFQMLPKKEEIISLGIPVLRDTNKNQIEVLVDNLRVREEGNINSNILGYINKGIYDYSDVVANDYYWYKTPVGWIAHSDIWSKVYEKEEIVEIVKPIDVVNENDKKVSFFRKIFNKIKQFFINLFK